MATIALVGGDEFRAGCEPMDRELLTFCSHTPPRVLIVPTAAARQRPDLAAKNGTNYFRSLGAEAEPLMLVDRTAAESAMLGDAMQSVDLVYFTGGDPNYLLDVLSESAAWDTIRAAADHGVVIAGSSAGAMVLGEWMGMRNWRAALGLVPHVCVLPHFTPGRLVTQEQRAGLPDDAIVLGIPAATAVVLLPDDRWRVLGTQPVTVSRENDSATVRPHMSFSLGE